MADDDWSPGTYIEGVADFAPYFRYNFRVGDWLVSAHWPSGHPVTSGPYRLSIEPAQDGPETEPTTRRGITGPVLRQIESVLAQRTNDTEHMRAVAEASTATGHRDNLADKLRGESPRSYAGDYYGDLLALVELLEATGDRTVNQTLSAELGLPLATLRSQLQRARAARRQEAGE